MAKRSSAPEYPDERLGNFLRGLFLGALVGGTVAVFRAQQSGDLTRAQLRKRLGEWRDEFLGLSGEARTAAGDFTTWAGGDDRSRHFDEATSATELTLVPPITKQATGPLPIVE